jgi:hypothetical protein
LRSQPIGSELIKMLFSKQLQGIRIGNTDSSRNPLFLTNIYMNNRRVYLTL